MWNSIKEWSEVYVSALLVLLLLTCVDPFEAFMPPLWDRTVVVLLIALYGLYAGIIYREASRDERERLHIARAERIGFLIGTGMLVMFIAFDAFAVTVEKSLIFVLGAMILAKMLGLLILRLRN